MSEFITREEFRDFRDDNKSDNKAILETVKDGFKQVNGRLDIVNGRLYKHEGDIAANTAKVAAHDEFVKNGPTMTKKAKTVIAGAGTVSFLAVLHSLFEMLKAVGPQLLKLFGH